MLNCDERFLFVIDDFLPEWLIGVIDSRMQNEPWWLGHYGDVQDISHTPIFGASYVTNGGQTGSIGNAPKEIPYVVTLLQDAVQQELPNRIPGWNYRRLFRARSNGQMPGQGTGPHTDGAGKGLWSAVYHINDSDGPTRFFRTNLETKTLDTFDVEFKKGRLTVFPSYYYHQGLAPTKNWRMSFGFIFEAKTPWDAEIWQ
jgi:hypothetical protein